MPQFLRVERSSHRGRERFRPATSRLLELDPGAAARADVVRVIDCNAGGARVCLRADATTQEALVFRTD